MAKVIKDTVFKANHIDDKYVQSLALGTADTAASHGKGLVIVTANASSKNLDIPDGTRNGQEVTVMNSSGDALTVHMSDSSTPPTGFTSMADGKAALYKWFSDGTSEAWYQVGLSES